MQSVSSNRFTEETLPGLYRELAREHAPLGSILAAHGEPPLWVRPNSYETLVLTILEQQVSLASAYAAYRKLKEKLGAITPAGLLSLTDEELRACSLTRQKMLYTRLLAEALVGKTIDLEAFEPLPDNAVRQELKKLKGIGDWTVDIYLLHALQRTDIFPVGDLALLNAIKMVHGLETLSKAEALALAEPYRPNRSIATMLYWHYYIRKKNIKLLH